MEYEYETAPCDNSYNDDLYLIQKIATYIEAPTCYTGYVRDASGECVIAPDPCNTNDSIIDNLNVQNAFTDIWNNSNASNTSVPMQDRREDGGWIVQSGNWSTYIPFPETWTRSPCGIQPPANWADDIPDNLVGWVHSHPFYVGEDRRSVCGDVEEAYVGGPSGPDFELHVAIMNETGNFSLMGYVIDGNFISSIDFLRNVVQFDRCGF